MSGLEPFLAGRKIIEIFVDCVVGIVNDQEPVIRTFHFDKVLDIPRCSR